MHSGLNEVGQPTYPSLNTLTQSWGPYNFLIAYPIKSIHHIKWYKKCIYTHVCKCPLIHLKRQTFILAKVYLPRNEFRHCSLLAICTPYVSINPDSGIHMKLHISDKCTFGPPTSCTWMTTLNQSWLFKRWKRLQASLSSHIICIIMLQLGGTMKSFVIKRHLLSVAKTTILHLPISHAMQHILITQIGPTLFALQINQAHGMQTIYSL